jgi:hypothetical protein
MSAPCTLICFWTWRYGEVHRQRCHAATYALCQPRLAELFRLRVSSKEHLSVRYSTNTSLGISFPLHFSFLMLFLFKFLPSCHFLLLHLTVTPNMQPDCISNPVYNLTPSSEVFEKLIDTQLDKLLHFSQTQDVHYQLHVSPLPGPTHSKLILRPPFFRHVARRKMVMFYQSFGTTVQDDLGCLTSEYGIKVSSPNVGTQLPTYAEQYPRTSLNCTAAETSYFAS